MEFVYRVEAGMPPLEAIRSATLAAAELLDAQDVSFVMKDGAVFKHRDPDPR